MDRQFLESLGVVIPEGTDPVYNRKALEVAFVYEGLRVEDPITVYSIQKRHYCKKTVKVFSKATKVCDKDYPQGFFLHFVNDTAYLLVVE